MRQRILLCVGLAFAAGLVPAGADDFDHGPVFSSLEENDLLVKTDRHYTQGIKLSYVGADGRVPDWLETLSEGFCPLGFEKRTDRWGLAVGQNIFTPSDITIPELQPDDRPYAGWLYLGFIWQRRGYTAEWLPTLESFELQLGIIGPESLAEQSQTWNTAFLDGDLFHDSHSVDKKPLVAEMKGGIALTCRWLELALSYVYRTPEFQEQGLDSVYGVLSVKFLF